jgi:hypothetical protein
MRKVTILLAVLFAVAATSSAEAARKKKAAAAPKPDPAVAAQQNSAKFMQDAWRPWTTTFAAPAKPAAKAKGKKKKRG